MCLLFEAIKVKQRQFCNLEYHQLRVDKSLHALFDDPPVINLTAIEIPSSIESEEIFKCRITYGKKIEKIKYIPYKKRRIKSLKRVWDDNIDYGLKYNDRQQLEDLKKLQENADEILIIKNGLVTDTSFTNIAFYDGETWYTPSTPLLRGTKRQKLLDEGLMKERKIRETDIPDFQYACPVNAFFDLLPENYIPVKDIY